jgi:thymidylate synthase (FAD)
MATCMIERTADQIDVLDHGFVRLDGALASDLSVINGARVSFGSHKDEMDERDAGLIRFLMRERHGSPFEHNLFRFHIKCPLFVAREWQRHRISSFNERSGRYSEMPDEFCIPAAEDVRTQVGKPGSYTFEPVADEVASRTRQRIAESYRAAYAAYQAMLADGVAKEVARTVLPLGLYTEFYWSVNARSLMNFLSLRNAEPAQREIRAFAAAVEVFFEREMPVTHAAFVQNDRTAP